MKKLLGIIIVLAALGGAAYLYLGGAVKGLIERAGTAALGTPVRVTSLQFSLTDKKATMGRLTVDNPKGFGDLLLKTQSIAFRVGEVSQTLVVLDEVVVEGMQVTYSMGTGGTNFDAMRKNMKASGKSAGEPAVPAPKLVIKKLKIRNAQLVPAIAGLGSEPIDMPDLTLTDVGTKSKPATAEEVAEQVLNRILSASSNAVLKNKLTKPVGKAVDEAKKGLKGLFK